MSDNILVEYVARCLHENNGKAGFVWEFTTDEDRTLHRQKAQIAVDAVISFKNEQQKHSYKTPETPWEPCHELCGYEKRINPEGHRETRYLGTLKDKAIALNCKHWKDGQCSVCGVAQQFEEVAATFHCAYFTQR